MDVLTRSSESSTTSNPSALTYPIREVAIMADDLTTARSVELHCPLRGR